jgi:hypothetical protein
VGRYRLDASCSVQGSVGGSCEHGNEPSGSIEGGEFIDWLNDCWFFKEDSTPWGWLVSQNKSIGF